MLSRRRFIKLSAAAGLVLILPRDGILPVFAQGVSLLDPATQPKFLNPVPNALDPGFIFQPKNKKKQTYKIGMYQFQQWLGLIDPGTNAPMMTTVWGYGDNPNTGTFPGKTFEVQSGQRVEVKWTNNLVDAFDNPLPHLLPVDTTLHWAFGHTPYSIAGDGVPVVPHVHGGHTESDSDGLPEYWFTPGWKAKGPRWAKKDYVYDNDQEAGTIWYHDHALGITRLNVYAGLAGFFIIRDDQDTGKWNNPLKLPALPYEVAIAIQDRMFDATGQLYLPSANDLAPGIAPSVVAEFFGDHILVNGMAWPKQEVEPRHYRYRVLNGSDSRFYVLHLQEVDEDGDPTGDYLPFYQIGTDDGLLDAPVPLDTLVIGPGERADIVINFTGRSGKQLMLTNTGPDDPFRGLNANGSNSDGEGGVLPAADPASTGRVMLFDVNQPLDLGRPDNFNPIAPLRAVSFTVAGSAVRTRKLLLFEGEDKYGRLQPLLGIVDLDRTVPDGTSVNGMSLDGTLLWDDPITEVPNLGDVEEWEVYNATEDAHPIHLHLVTFELLNREGFDGGISPKDNVDPKHPDDPPTAGGVLSNIVLEGSPAGPLPNETGPKDTAQMFPGQVTRIRAKFDRPGRYVWHCHILSHEDHEMMRPYYVSPYPSSAYPKPAGDWIAHSNEAAGEDVFDPHWLQLSMQGINAPFLHGQTYGMAMNMLNAGAWYTLAREYIAYRLNLLAGATDTVPPATVTDAEVQLMGKAPGTLTSYDAAAFEALASVLRAFNEGP
ncbi:MAG: outer spore coat copper-dependent laccase CotA [Anaerolineae bacterium]